MGFKMCNNDCFNCIYDDCIKSTISKKERDSINKRDKMNEYGQSIIGTGSCVRGRNNKASIKFKI